MNIKGISEIASPFSKELSQISRGNEAEGPGAAGGNFASFLNQSVNDVNTLLNASDKKSVAVAVGKSENLHDAMIGYEKAETALKLLVQVRNKAIEAYHEVMRMQA